MQNIPDEIFGDLTPFELVKNDIHINDDYEFDDEDDKIVTVYIATHFDYNKKFGLNLDAERGEWLNMYGTYHLWTGELEITCVICTDTEEMSFKYCPTMHETETIVWMIEKMLQKEREKGENK